MERKKELERETERKRERKREREREREREKGGGDESMKNIIRVITFCAWLQLTR